MTVGIYIIKVIPITTLTYVKQLQPWSLSEKTHTHTAGKMRKCGWQGLEQIVMRVIQITVVSSDMK